MADGSKIEWTDATWNPVTGCAKVSAGCDFCYAETFAERWRGTPGHYFEAGFDVVLRPDKLDLPLRWKRPRRIFVNSMSDLFHDEVPDEYIARVFAMMAAAPQHTFQLLTKRHARMRSLIGGIDGSPHRLLEATTDEATALAIYEAEWPLPNLWLGVSVENQQWADIRISALLDTPAAVRWISAEPLLGPVDLDRYLWLAGGSTAGPWTDGRGKRRHVGGLGRMLPTGMGGMTITHIPSNDLSWVVVGGESGPGARPMSLSWARSLRDQCGTAEVPFVLKQWGNWVPPSQMTDDTFMSWDAEHGTGAYDRDQSVRVGKGRAGRLLDGRTWDQYPAARTAVAS